MYHCPCCGEEFDEAGFCQDCRLPLKEGGRPANHCKLCDCDDHPIGDSLAERLGRNDGEAVAEVASLTGYKNERDTELLKKYIDALTSFNA